MDAAKEILNIISPWVSKRRTTLSAGVSFIDKKDVWALRNYSYEMAKLSLWYANVCGSPFYHRSLRSLIGASGYFKQYEASRKDWDRLEALLSGVVDEFLQQSGAWLSNGRGILALVEKMDLMEQLDCTIGELTAEKLSELQSRSLSLRDLKTVGGVQDTLAGMLTAVKATQERVHMVNNVAEQFSVDLRVSILPALERLSSVTMAQRCRTKPCDDYVVYIDSVLNGLVNNGVVDAAASAFKDLQVALSSYLQSKVSELAGMHTNLAVLFFAVQFKGVLDVWQTVDGMLQATKKALQ